MSNAASTPEFKQILTGLYSGHPHWKSGEVLREAWKEYKQRHGQLGPSGSTQRKRYAMRKTAEGMNPRKKKPRSLIGVLTHSNKFGDGKIINVEGDRVLVDYGNKRIWQKPYNLQFLNPRKKKSRRSCPTCGGLMSGSVCLTCISTKNPRRKRRKNPIAVYNPKVRLTKLPATQIEIRYKRTNGKYSGKWFKHEFKSSIAILGMSDGNILLKSLSGKKLWGTA